MKISQNFVAFSEYMSFNKINDNIEIVYMCEENVVVPKITKTYHNKFSKSLDVPNV